MFGGTKNASKSIEKTWENVIRKRHEQMKQKLCQNDAKKGPEIATKSKNTVKNERRNRCGNLLLSKMCRKSNKLAQGLI